MTRLALTPAVRHLVRLAAGLVLSAGVLAAPAATAAAEAPDFAIRVDDGLLDRHVTHAFVMPDEAIDIAARDVPADAVMRLTGEPRLSIEATGQHTWTIAAPDAPGVYTITLANTAANSARRINLFVMQPFDPDRDAINGYRIGHYEAKALRGREIYAPPEALMPVTKATRDARLSPHFTIGQFLCHQQPDHWPKYIRVRSRLVAKLESVIDELADRGIKANTLTVMSGYRTPQYNRDIGNTTSYSRHLYGGAADIYVDTNGDDRMDDLNGDGQVDIGDAEWLADLIESMASAEPRFTGGLSAYPANSAHGPFVHTDVRGVAVRW